jgi:hypothetical protein
MSEGTPPQHAPCWDGLFCKKSLCSVAIKMNVGIVKEEGESSSYVRQTDSGSSSDPTSGSGFVRDGLTLGGETAATTTFVASAAAAAANHGTSGGVTNTIGAVMILNYIQSSNFIELCCCFGLLIAGMVVEFRGIPLNQRPLPFVQLQSTGEYIVNQMFNETFDGETVPSKWKTMSKKISREYTQQGTQVILLTPFLDVPPSPLITQKPACCWSIRF